MKQTTVPITSFILLDPIHANNPKTAITIGQGVLTKSFSYRASTKYVITKRNNNRQQSELKCRNSQ